MITPSTFFWRSAWEASVATRLESTPPLSPSTTRSKPTLRTSFWMNPTRIFRTSSGLIWSGGKTGSERLAGALMPDSAKLVDGELDALVTQERIGQPLASNIGEVDVGEHKRLVGILLLRDDVTVGPDHHRTAPEVGAVLEADAIAVEEESRQELGVGSTDERVRLRRAQALIGRDATAGAGGGADDHVHAFQAQDIGAAEVPDVLAHQDPGASEGRRETAEAITWGEVPLLVEHPVGWQVDLAMDVLQFAAAEVEAGVEVTVVGRLDHGAEHDVQLRGEAGQLAHLRAVELDRAVRHQVFEEVAGQAELRKNEQLGTGLGRLLDPLAVALEVATTVAQCRIDLRQGDREATVIRHAVTGAGRRTPPPRASHWTMAGAISVDDPRCTAARG